MTKRKPILRRLYWVLSDLNGQGSWPEGLLAELLPVMNHSAQLYLISEDLPGDTDHFLRVVDRVAAHLRLWGFCSINLRPVNLVREGGRPQLEGIYGTMLRVGNPFHLEALRHQVASRWTILPVLRARSLPELHEALTFAGFLRERMMMPSFCIEEPQHYKQLVSMIDANQERLVVEVGNGPLEALVLNDLFDEVLLWALSSAGGFSEHSCHSLVVDTVRGRLRRCPWGRVWEYTAIDEVLSEDLGGKCLRCWYALPGRLRETLRLNERVEEGEKIQHQLGVFALSRGDSREAERHLKHLAGHASSHEMRGESYLYLGILRLQDRNIEAAHAALKEARGLLENSGEVLYHLGRCEFEWRDYIAAADLFEKATELGVSREIEDDLLLYLAIAYIQLEEFDDALRALNMTEGSLPSIQFYRGMALLGLGRLQEALEWFMEALKSGPAQEDLASVRFYIGHCLKEMEQWTAAISHLQVALRADPQSYDVWNLLGYCYFKQGRHKAAIQAFLKALGIRPKSAIDYANVASNLRDLGDLEEAVKWYRKAVRLDPTLGFAVENLRKLEGMKRDA